ncbi:Cof-type HAD-IIB family hydrolase [Virgibacillus soli]|uniref:Cof-type HAD-IIB family hydrolase n=1 Tax=Paracerasibacillus soli TaxID=480284 RepID=A0ABU5CRU1_9BACI|nr:Cof-type HAD-IIB family hydrolase [Virgibacillus soli]MDY0409082.1 Cof-type HAD-IIB family hydrolase [Virgibacillus soli]
MRLIATDMDGTLLNEIGEVSKENAAAITRALEQGIEVVVATGRAYESAIRPLQHANLQLPIISLNGAISYTEDKQVVSEYPLTAEHAKIILQSCQRHQVYYEMFTNKGLLATNGDDFIQIMLEYMQATNHEVDSADIEAKVRQRFVDENVTFTSDFDQIVHDSKIEIFKILVFTNDQSKINQIKAELGDTPIAITASSSISLEFNDTKAQKGIALQQFATSKGIDMRDVMALGDHLNDLSMLKMAGRGVAMGNATEEIKQICKHITKTNAEHGVAVAIEEILRTQVI